MSKHLQLTLVTAMLCAMVACGSKEAPAPQVSEGETIWNKNCKVCHAQGINGAPIIGNQAMWEERAAQGIPTLVQHAINGYGLMPAKGGNTDLPDADVEKAVKFMVSKVQ